MTLLHPFILSPLSFISSPLPLCTPRDAFGFPRSLSQPDNSNHIKPLTSPRLAIKKKKKEKRYRLCVQQECSPSRSVFLLMHAWASSHAAIRAQHLYWLSTKKIRTNLAEWFKFSVFFFLSWSETDIKLNIWAFFMLLFVFFLFFLFASYFSFVWHSPSSVVQKVWPFFPPLAALVVLELCLPVIPG